MKSPEQILNFILINQSNRQVCLDELETQLQLAKFKGIIQADRDINGRNEKLRYIDTDCPTRTISDKRPDRNANGINEE